MTQPELDLWLGMTAWDRVYWSYIRDRAIELDSDGCSGVPNWMVWTCYEHDVHYRTHMMLNGQPITKKQADYCLRIRIQQGSAYGVFSIVSWVRWAGVRILARAKQAWEVATD